MAVQPGHTLPLQPVSGSEAPGTASKPSFSLQGQSHSVCGRQMEEQGHQKLAWFDFGASPITLIGYGPFKDTWRLFLLGTYVCLKYLLPRMVKDQLLTDTWMCHSLLDFFLPYLWCFISLSYKVTIKIVIFFFLTTALYSTNLLWFVHLKYIYDIIQSHVFEISRIGKRMESEGRINGWLWLGVLAETLTLKGKEFLLGVTEMSSN